jgi:hypothetical protein
MLAEIVGIGAAIAIGSTAGLGLAVAAVEADEREKRREKDGKEPKNQAPDTKAQALAKSAKKNEKGNGLRDLVGDNQRRAARREERIRQEQERAQRAAYVPPPPEEVPPHEAFANWVRTCVKGTNSDRDYVSNADLVNSYVDYCNRHGYPLLDAATFVEGLIHFSETYGYAVIEGGSIVCGKLQEG